MATTIRILAEIGNERKNQIAKFGEQNPDDGTGSEIHWLLGLGGGPARFIVDRARRQTDRRAKTGRLTWRDILTEEVAEAYTESDVKKLRAELVQVAAVAVAWIEAIDRRA